MPNKIVYKVSDYKTLDDLYTRAFAQLRLLTDSNYVCWFYRAAFDNNLFMIDFASMDPTISDTVPMWLDDEEAGMILKHRGVYDENADLTNYIKSGGDA